MILRIHFLTVLVDMNQEIRSGHIRQNFKVNVFRPDRNDWPLQPLKTEVVFLRSRIAPLLHPDQE